MQNICGGRWRMRALAFACVLALTLILSACARHGAEAPAVSPPASAAVAAPSANASFAKIIAVEDLRKFDARPRDPSTPSLNDAADFGNQDRMARAVGRQRNMDGAAGPNIFLPANETVARLVRAAIEKALRDKGYTIVAEDSPHYGAAAALSVQINQFWIWQTPAPFAESAEFRTVVVMTGDALREPSINIESYATDESADVRASHWRQIMESGMGDFGKQLGERLKSPSGS